MKMNKYIINSRNDIIILKQNLMETTEGTIITEGKDKNTPNVGEIFEENIRETFINEYNFVQGMYYSEIFIMKISLSLKIYLELKLRLSELMMLIIYSN